MKGRATSMRVFRFSMIWPSSAAVRTRVLRLAKGVDAGLAAALPGLGDLGPEEFRVQLAFVDEPFPGGVGRAGRQMGVDHGIAFARNRQLQAFSHTVRRDCAGNWGWGCTDIDRGLITGSCKEFTLPLQIAGDLSFDPGEGPLFPPAYIALDQRR